MSWRAKMFKHCLGRGVSPHSKREVGSFLKLLVPWGLPKAKHIRVWGYGGHLKFEKLTQNILRQNELCWNQLRQRIF